VHDVHDVQERLTLCSGGQGAAVSNLAVPTLHFLKDNQELSSVSLDENSRIEILDNS